MAPLLVLVALESQELHGFLKGKDLYVMYRSQLVKKVRFGLTPRRAFAFPKEKIAAPKENPLKELLCVSSPERDFFSSISRQAVSLNSWQQI